LRLPRPNSTANFVSGRWKQLTPPLAYQGQLKLCSQAIICHSRIFKCCGSLNVVLTLLPDNILLANSADGATGQPQYYQIEGGNLVLSPAPDSDYSVKMVYHAKIPALSGSNPTNWLLTKYPDLYLYGSLVEAVIYTNDVELLPIWQSKADAAIEDAWQSSNAESFSGGPLRSYSSYIV